MRLNGILSSQRNTAEDDEDEDEVGEVGVMDEVMAGDTQTENGKQQRGWIIKAWNKKFGEI